MTLWGVTDTPGMPSRFAVCLSCVLLLVTARAEAQFSAPTPVHPAEDFNIELAMMFWTPTPELTITSGSFAPVGTVDFVDAFGLDNERFREFRVTTKASPKHKIRYSSVNFRYNKETVLEGTITYAGRTFTGGVAAAADIEWRLWRIGYEWDAISSSRGFIGLVTEVGYNKVRAKVESSVGSAIAEQKAWVPAIGGIARVYAGEYVSMTGEFTMLKIDRSEYRGTTYNLDLYGTVHLGRSVGVQVGYRSVQTEYLVDDDEGDLKMKGLYFGGLVRF